MDLLYHQNLEHQNRHIEMIMMVNEYEDYHHNSNGSHSNNISNNNRVVWRGRCGNLEDSKGMDDRWTKTQVLEGLVLEVSGIIYGKIKMTMMKV